MEGRTGEGMIAKVEIFHLLGQKWLKRGLKLHIKRHETPIKELPFN